MNRKYDYYRYDVLSDGISVPRNLYDVEVKYQHPSITKRSGKNPYLKFDERKMILKIYNDPILTDNVEEIVSIYVTDRLTGEVYRKRVRVTWYCVIPAHIDWDKPTLERVHPIVETLYDRYSYDEAVMDIRGTESIVGNVEGSGYDIYQYYFYSSVPVASDEYSISAKIGPELVPYCVWDTKSYRLYVKKGVQPEGEFNIQLNVSSKYLKENTERTVKLRWGHDHTNPKYLTAYDNLKVTIDGKERITPTKGSGYDNYYYVIKSVPPLAWSQYGLDVKIENAPASDAVIFDTDAMILRVNRNYTYNNPCRVTLKVTNIFNSLEFSKTIVIDENSEVDTL